MSYDNDGPTLMQGIGITTLVLFVLGFIITGAMIGCPQYNVYSSRKEGEAILAHAQSSKEVAVTEARAKMESASLLAQADTIRAHGIAASNQIIGKSLENNPAYLNWLWIDQIKDTKNQIIYVPAEKMGIPIMEATRLSKPSSR
jgi:hypothetical protein